MNRSLLLTICLLAAGAAHAQNTEWAVPSTLLPSVTTSNFYKAHPPLLFNPTNGRLLVQAEGAISVSTNSTLSVYITNPSQGTNTASSVYVRPVGSTLVTNVTMAVDTTATGVAANDVLAPGIEITGAVRESGGTAFLKCVSIATGDNNAPAIRLLICNQAITWPATNAVANLTASEFSRVAGIVDFSTWNFKLAGTNYFATKDVSIGVRPSATSLFIYPICTALITNANSATLKLTIFQD